MESKGTSKYRRLSARSLLLYEMAKRRAERSQKLFSRELARSPACGPQDSDPFHSDKVSGIGRENQVAKENN